MCTPEQYLERGVEELYKAYYADKALSSVNLSEQTRQLLVISAEEYDRKAHLLFRLSIGDESIIELFPGYILENNCTSAKDIGHKNIGLQAPEIAVA